MSFFLYISKGSAICLEFIFSIEWLKSYCMCRWQCSKYTQSSFVIKLASKHWTAKNFSKNRHAVEGKKKIPWKHLENPFRKRFFFVYLFSHVWACADYIDAGLWYFFFHWQIIRTCFPIVFNASVECLKCWKNLRCFTISAKWVTTVFPHNWTFVRETHTNSPNRPKYLHSSNEFAALLSSLCQTYVQANNNMFYCRTKPLQHLFLVSVSTSWINNRNIWMKQM